MTLESVQLDILGEQHMDFEETGLKLVGQGFSAAQLPTVCGGRAVAWNREIAYQDIEWVGVLRRRQWEMLAPCVLFLPLGLFWTFYSMGQWGPLAVSVVVLFLLGILPLAVFLRGRPFVGIATKDEIVVLPLDRRKKALRRILGLLRQQLPMAVPWEMEGTEFHYVSGLDSRPPSGRGFDQKRYAAISVLLGLYGLSNHLAGIKPIRWVGILLGMLVMLTALVWVARWAWRKANWR